MILTKEYIKQVVSDYFKDKPVKKVYLFGSYANESADENSDVDLLIDLDYGKRIGWQFFEWNVELSNMFQKKVDVIANAEKESETSNWNFILKINKEKKSVYEKE
jgi:uncharacterized protein